MSKQFDNVCKALDLAEESVDFYENSVAECPGGPGKEILEKLRDQEEEHLHSLEDIQTSMESGEKFEKACDMSKLKEHPSEGQVRKVAAEHGEVLDCATELGVINGALELEKRTVDFYETWHGEAESKTEKGFVNLMLQEQRGHVLMLGDLQFYYEDPEGFSLQQDDQILDGA